VKDKDEAVKKLKELKKSVKNQQKLASSATATDYYKVLFEIISSVCLYSIS
jgi:hypothetical protein